MEQTGYHVVLEPDPEGGYVAVVPAFPDLARKPTGVAIVADQRSALDYGEKAPRPDEFSAEEETLDWEGEGWS